MAHEILVVTASGRTITLKLSSAQALRRAETFLKRSDAVDRLRVDGRWLPDPRC